MFRGRK
jgi:hypothetical protein